RPLQHGVDRLLARRPRGRRVRLRRRDHRAVAAWKRGIRLRPRVRARRRRWPHVRRDDPGGEAFALAPGPIVSYPGRRVARRRRARGAAFAVAVIDIAGFVADLKDHAVEHGFHVHDERHFVESYSLRQNWEVDLHPEEGCEGPVDLYLS